MWGSAAFEASWGKFLHCPPSLLLSPTCHLWWWTSRAPCRALTICVSLVLFTKSVLTALCNIKVNGQRAGWGPARGWVCRPRALADEAFSFYLRNIHDRIAAQGPGWGKIVGAQQSGDDPILINASDHGAVHEVDQPGLVHRDAWGREAKTGNSAFEVVTTHILMETCGWTEHLPFMIWLASSHNIHALSKDEKTAAQRLVQSRD